MIKFKGYSCLTRGKSSFQLMISLLGKREEI
uniref:Uncharacterized protein n=1 Tax=Rhizophora mucronata TaxID=61149 RepID=A0A2P2N5U6_RHIMU